jgi:hypothetical protein
MNQILTDILGLLKRKKIVANAKDTNLIPLGSKKSGSLGLSGPNPSEDITLITAKDFVTNYIAPTVGTSGDNTFLGKYAFINNVSGVGNTAIGSKALEANLSGNYNTGVGRDALISNTTGSDNSGFGVVALNNNTIGNQNSGSGVVAGYYNVTGNSNTSMGVGANYFNPVGSENAAFGYRAGVSLSSGDGNTFVGPYTGEGPSFSGSVTGSNNTVLGIHANHKDRDNCVVIGKGAEANADNQFSIGSSGTPLGTIAAYTGAAAETWEVRINGVTKRIMLAP